MYNNDKILLEQAYHKIYEDNNPFKPANDDDMADRQSRLVRINTQKVNDYIKNTPAGRGLELRSSPHIVIPDTLTKVDGPLDIAHSDIETLPNDLVVMGYLNLRGSKISKLPENLTVFGFIDISNTSIDHLPDSMNFHGLEVWVTGSKLSLKYTEDELDELYPNLFYKFRWNDKFLNSRIFNGAR